MTEGIVFVLFYYVVVLIHVICFTEPRGQKAKLLLLVILMMMGGGRVTRNEARAAAKAGFPVKFETMQF